MLKIKLNRVTFKSANEKGQLVEKFHDLDVKVDKFFDQHAGLLFPDAIAGHEEELKAVSKQEKDISAKASGNASALFGNQNTKDLVAAVDTLPALLEKKRSLEEHTNIFQATMDVVTQRHTPDFSLLEQRLIEGFNVPRAEVLALLSEKVNKLTPLLDIYIMCCCCYCIYLGQRRR
jgi:hypothetical protein